MKNNLFKKSMSVFLAVLMIMSCWVWTPGIAEHNHASAVATDTTYRKADKYGTPAYTTANTYYVYFANGNNKLWVYFPTHIHLDVSETLQSAGYKINVKYEMGSNPAYKVLLGGPIWGDYLDASGKPDAYYTMTNIFDNYTVDASIPNGGSSSNVSIDKRGSGDSFTINSQTHETYVKFAATSSGPPNTANIYLMGTPKSSYKGTTSTFNTAGTSVGSYGMGHNGSNGKDNGITGMVDGKWGQNDGNYKLNNWAEMYWQVTIYDKSTLNATINEANNIINNLSYKYTTDSINALKTALNNNKGVLTTRATTQSNINTANDNIREAINGLKRTYDLTYENLFSYSDFINSESTTVDGGGATASGSSIKYDYSTGTINATTGSGEVFTKSNASATMYSVPVTAGTQYTLDYDAEYKGGIQTFVFFYNNAGQAVTIPGSSDYFYNNYDGKAITFTVPEGATRAGFRFGTYGNSGNYANYSNIRFYETSRQDIVDSADAQGVNRVIYAAGDSIATNTVPTITRTGYTFNDWLVKDVDNNGDGKWDSVYDYDVDAYPMGASFVIYSDWTEHKYNITFNANGGSGSTAGINNVLYSADTKLTANGFSRTGYTFTGWNTKADGTGTAIADGATVSKLTATDGGTVTLYAQWSVNKYTVTFEKIDGTTDSKQYEYGTEASEITKPANTASGYDANEHFKYSWPTIANVTGNVTYKEEKTSEAHSFTTHTDKDDTYHTDKCSCGYSKDVVHSYDNGVQTSAPGCTTEGVKTYTCSVCNGTKTEAISSTGHIPAVAVRENENPATCEAEGSYDEVVYCSVCKAEISRTKKTIEKLAHTEVIIPAVESTCTATGLTEGKKCSVCGTIIVAQQTTNKKAHEMGDWEEVLAPTCITDGQEQSKCANCDYIETRTVPATGEHIYGGWTYTNGKSFHEGKCIADSNCKATTSQDHSFTEDVKPKEGSNSFHDYKCSVCDARGAVINGIPKAGVGEDCSYNNCEKIENNHSYHNVICKCGREKQAEHDIEILNVIKTPTCTKKGSQEEHCKICDYTFTRELPMLDHSYTGDYKWNNYSDKPKTHSQLCVNGCNEYGNETECEFEITDTTASSCTDQGSTTYTCKVCKNSYTVYAQILGHNFTEFEAKTATCTEDGNKAYKQCTVCNLYFAENAGEDSEDGKKDTTSFVISKLGHKMELTSAQVDPTCTATGTKAVYTCANGCGCESGGEEIPALGHIWTVSYSFAEDGSSCTATRVCGRDESHVETATAKITSEITKNETCTTKGETTYIATFAEDWAETKTLEVEDRDALDHSWKEATYSFAEDGSSCTATRVCGRDASHVETATATMITSAVKTEATCKEMGTTTYTATFAETWAEPQTKDVKDIPLADHSYKDATCDKPSTCTVCGVTSGTAVGHLWTDTTYNWFETKEGWSCTAERVCQRTQCGVKTTATVPAELEITKQATCEEKGVATYTANFVSSWTEVQTKTVEIDALGHDYKVTKSVSPNCESAGYKLYTCQNDSGHSYKEVIKATGHKYGDWVVVKDATCTTGEVRHRTCSACGGYEEKVGTQTRPHVISYEPGREATCLVEGYTAFETCYNCDYHTQSVVIEKLPHEDKDGDGKCDRCEGIMTSKGACNCICHKTENKFLNFIYKILRFFWKLFKVQKSCLCGNEHY